MAAGDVPIYYFPPGIRFEALVETQGLGPVGLLYDEPPLLDSEIARRIVFAGDRVGINSLRPYPSPKDATPHLATHLFRCAATELTHDEKNAFIAANRLHPPVQQHRVVSEFLLVVA